jgi:PKD repeat protein
VTQWSIDFGDGSAPTVTSTPTTVQHAYAVAGTYTVTLTATDGYGADGRGTSTASATERILSNQVFHPVTPTRILDTRSGTGTGGVIAPVPAKGTLVLKVDGAGPVPASGVAAVTLNLTATNPTAGGNIIAYADGNARPSTSNVDFGTGGTVANQVIAQVGSDGSIDLYNDGTGTVDLVADVAGYYGSGAGVGLETLGTPIRILDTRNGSGTGGVIAPVPAKGTLMLTAAETGNLLSAGYTAVLNVTVTDAKSGGYLSVYRDGTSRPSTSSLNFGAGGTVANEVDVQVGSDGSIDFYNNASSTVDVIADQLGMFTTSGGVGYVPISPERVLDTRNAVGAPAGAVGPFGTVQTILDGVDGLPQNLQTVAANVTVTDPTGSGDIEVYPDYLSNPPGVSTLNFGAGATVANATTMSADNNGVDLYNESSGSSQLIMDVFGYYG